MASPSRNYATKAAIRRVIENVRGCGIDVGEVVLSPDGTIRLLPASAVKEPENAYDRWKAGQ